MPAKQSMNEQHTAQPARSEAPIILAPRPAVTTLRIHAFLAIIFAIALRMLFIFKFPASAGDTELYLQLAYNWLDHHVYGLWLNGHLIPTDLRVPGYPAFLAGIAMLVGRSVRAISLSQCAVDLGTCYLTATLAAGLAPRRARHPVWIAGFWLAATCPFIANYTAIALTETLVTCIATAAIACFVVAIRPRSSGGSSPVQDPDSAALRFAALGSFLAGIATLVRPEMPLIFAVATAVFGLRFRGVLSARKIALYGSAMACAFALPLAPWFTRNLVTLHEIQITAPRYATLPNEYAPVGYYSWTGTWLERYRDIYFSVWKLSEEPMEVEDLPSSAFDSPQERTRVASLIDQYNASTDLDISPEVDREFAELARERTKRHPLRTYLRVPFERALTIWFTPRTELLPVDGKILPLKEQWRDSHANVLTTAGFAALGYLYVALAVLGAWVGWRSGRTKCAVSSFNAGFGDTTNLWGIFLLFAYLAIRTAFLTTVEAPEPRYVLSCYPLVLGMAALLFGGGSDQRSSTGSG